MHKLSLFPLILLFPVQAFAAAEPTATLWTEASAIWQSSNDVQIPNDTGTPFDLADLGTGPVLGGRIYAGLRLFQRHELRALYAPFTLAQEGSYPFDIAYMGETYAGGEPLQTSYRFNSYRLTYRFTVLQKEHTSLKVGFTGKIRDAEISLAQDDTRSSRANLGFVPLLHLAFEQQFSDEIGLLLDADGLWSPFGRAEDVALQATFRFHDAMRGLVGYRTVEGGAKDGGGVYTFAWLHFAALGLQVEWLPPGR